MTVEYTTDIQNQILSHLDGWAIYDNDDSSNTTETVTTGIESNVVTGVNDGEVQPFITDITTYADNPNKKITSTEVQSFYEEALDKAYMHTNRLNVEDLSELEEEMFIKGVCLLAASDLWNKYNIRVNNEDMEDTYVQSYGGLLYKQALNILNSFINQRVFTLTSIKQKNNTCSNGGAWYL